MDVLYFLKRIVEKKFLTPFSLIFRILLLVYSLFFIYNIYTLAQYYTNRCTAEETEYICTVDVEYNGGVEYNRYLFKCNESLRIMEIIPHPYIVLQSKDEPTFYTLNLPMSAKRDPEGRNFALYQETSLTELDDILEGDSKVSVDYYIIFELLAEYDDSYITHYYLMDQQKNIVPITKRNANKILQRSTQELNLY